MYHFPHGWGALPCSSLRLRLRLGRLSVCIRTRRCTELKTWVGRVSCQVFSQPESASWLSTSPSISLSARAGAIGGKYYGRSLHLSRQGIFLESEILLEMRKGVSDCISRIVVMLSLDLYFFTRYTLKYDLSLLIKYDIEISTALSGGPSSCRQSPIVCETQSGLQQWYLPDLRYLLPNSDAGRHRSPSCSLFQALSAV